MAGLILTSHTEGVAGGLALTCGRRDKYGDGDSRRKSLFRSHLSRGLEQMHSLGPGVLFLLIEDQGLYWEFTEVGIVESYDFCWSFNHTAPCQVRAIIWHFNM